MKMRSAFAAFVFALLLLPGIALAQPPGCSWEGDPCMRYGFGQYDGLPYNQPGPDYTNIYPGGTVTYTLAPYNATPYNPGPCKLLDTLCCHIWSVKGWNIVTDPPAGTPEELLAGGYIWYQDITITAPCDASIGDKDTLIAKVAYTNIAGVCAPECGDCLDPNIRPATGVKYYNADTLILTIVAPPAAIVILQDTLSFIGQGQPQAYVPFSVCNENECVPSTDYIYNITSRGHVGAPINTIDTVSVPGGDCRKVYGVVSASMAVECTYDTLTIIAWSVGEPVVYDTCVQVVHVISACSPCIPVFTPAVAAVLVLALLAAAALFMRRTMRRSA